MSFFTCGPEEAIIMSGGCFGGTQPKLIVGGGRVFKWPFCQIVQRISLNVMTLEIHSPKIYTGIGVPISVTSVAQVKIHSTDKSKLVKACQMFLGFRQSQIEHVASETLEGHQRAIMGRMSVREIYQDRTKFAFAIQEVAKTDLESMGMTILSFQIKDISDDVGYLHYLGVPRTEEVLRDARIGEAESDMEAKIKEAKASENAMRAKYANDIIVAESKKDFEIKQAVYEMEVQTKKAEADMATSLQKAVTQQEIRRQELQVEIVQKGKDIQIQEQEILRMERQLDATVRKPSQAEAYRLKTEAEGNKIRRIREAEAEAEAIKARGEADAAAIAMKAHAEAKAMKLKADAFKDYKEAAIIKMVVGVIPEIAAAVSRPLKEANKITMVAGEDGDVGAERMTQEMLGMMAQVPEAVKQMTGVDVFAAITNRTTEA
jgi:flotillin